MKKKVIVMAWGGTWWHVFPIKSLIETIISEEKYTNKVKEIIRFWSKNSLEQETAKKFWNKVRFISIFSWKFRRETPLKSHLKTLETYSYLWHDVYNLFFIYEKQKLM